MELSMSMFATKADYWKARAELAEQTLAAVAERLGVGEDARIPSVILANVEQAARRSRCLAMIEEHHTITVADDDGDERPEQLLNWGAEPAEYLKTYKAMTKQGVTQYVVLYEDGHRSVESFTESQAFSAGAVLAKNGLPMIKAQHMVDHWNEIAARQGNKLRYALPSDELLRAGE